MHRKTTVPESLFNKVTCCMSATLLKKKLQEFCEIYKNTYFAEQAVASYSPLISKNYFKTNF